MTYDALPTIYSVFNGKWPEFKLKRAKRTWVKETDDRVLLLIHLQRSRWGSLFYLNFGVYFLDIEPIKGPSPNLPKSNEWHLFARYERFEELSTSEYNVLFSLEQSDSASLETRCTEIANFGSENILPQLKLFGSLLSIQNRIAKSDANKVFYPFNSQRISGQEILNYVRDQPRLRNA